MLQLCNSAPRELIFLNVIFVGHIKKKNKAQNFPPPNHKIPVKRFPDTNLLKNPTLLQSEELSWLSERNLFFLIEVGVPDCTAQLFWGVLDDKGQKYSANNLPSPHIHLLP